MEVFDKSPISVPEISCDQLEGIIREHMRGWAFFEKPTRKTVQFYCTHCHEWHNWEKGKMPKHDSEMTCDLCGGKLRVYHLRYSHKNQKSCGNFCVLLPISKNALAVRAIKIEMNFKSYQPWERYELEPDVDVYKTELYYFTPGTARRFVPSRKTDERGNEQFCWREALHVKAPCHFGIKCYGYADNSYILIADDDVKHNNLLWQRSHVEEVWDMNHDPIAWLGEFCKEPTLEVLFETGFKNVADDYMMNVGATNRSRNRRVLELSSNNIKRMLRITTKSELLYLEDGDMAFVEMHQRMLKAFPKMSPEQVVDFEIWLDLKKLNHGRIANIAEKTGLSAVKIKNYIMKQWEMGVLPKGGNCPPIEIIWSDMIDSAKELGYDLSDSLISCPKKLVEMHDRNAKSVEALKHQRADLMYEKTFEEQQKRYAPLMFEKYELITILPKRYSDIIAEGKMLSNCLATYAKRHAEGQTVIMFIRRKSAPDAPYFAAEISLTDKDEPLRQFYGFKNNMAKNPKTLTERKFEKRYNDFLKEQVGKIKTRKKEKSA